MKLIVGLGNPGAQYAATRHNVGWLVVDELARQGEQTWRKDRDAEVCEVRLGAQKVLLVKPQTFMNTSGRAVVPLVRFYKLALSDLLVVQDDLDSPFGLLKVRLGGRSGGQNGLKDIIRGLGSEDFARLKIGISRPPPGWDVSGWVLSKWRAEEEATLRTLIDLGTRAAAIWAESGLLEAQRAFNGTDLRPKPPTPEKIAAAARDAAATGESSGS
ncbi:aminoacyl-tRNA hydrolase [Deinococcus peraridilitoris]|uniref:Peptidyl-tRNA hydrolase n=1 Tax=Deinococcus peraridilitoris (strain DSM 19664 / LMG 22246 / CIP 109416 / KR-200) TaxID=937777 RepID=L0A1V4_DEIPD|nr:aminoacyl-tRNA hydrolase [Deinococcus peraridilitoris]AFZ67826.1 peptidyl-tRNA hydrolase [Deinococcus peraridilitoris DSM 19664]